MADQSSDQSDSRVPRRIVLRGETYIRAALSPPQHDDLEVFPAPERDLLRQALEEIIDDLVIPLRPRGDVPDYIAHAIQVAQMALGPRPHGSGQSDESQAS